MAMLALIDTTVCDVCSEEIERGEMSSVSHKAIAHVRCLPAGHSDLETLVGALCSWLTAQSAPKASQAALALAQATAPATAAQDVAEALQRAIGQRARDGVRRQSLGPAGVHRQSLSPTDIRSRDLVAGRRGESRGYGARTFVLPLVPALGGGYYTGKPVEVKHLNVARTTYPQGSIVYRIVYGTKGACVALGFIVGAAPGDEHGNAFTWVKTVMRSNDEDRPIYIHVPFYGDIYIPT